MGKRSQTDRMAHLLFRLYAETLNPFWKSRGILQILDEGTGKWIVDEQASRTWDRLPEDSNDPDDIADKNLFRSLAAHVLRELQPIDSERMRVETLAQLCRNILHRSLTPFFAEIRGLKVHQRRSYLEWDQLPEYSENPFDQDDKMFFKAIAVYILASMEIYKRSYGPDLSEADRSLWRKAIGEDPEDDQE